MSETVTKLGELNPDAATVSELVSELSQMIKTVPPQYQWWDHERTIQYKEIARKVTVTLDKGNRDRASLLRFYQRIRTFY